MNRIAAIQSLIAIASVLEDRGMIAEASALDQIMHRIASIESEGGLQGDYPVSPRLLSDLEKHDPSFLGQLRDPHATLSPGYQSAEDMIDSLQDRFQEDDMYDGEDLEAIDPHEREIRELANRWSSGPGSALYGLAYTGLVYSLEQRDELIKEIDQATEINNDPEEHMRLQMLRNHVTASVPIMTIMGLDQVTHVERHMEPNNQGGNNIYLLFQTENGLQGQAYIYADEDNRKHFISAGVFVDGQYQAWNWNDLQVAQFASALYEKLVVDTIG